MAHCVLSFVLESVRLILDETDDHGVEVEEEHDEVEAELDE